MFDGLLAEFDFTEKQFKKHVPASDEVFLILKAHLVIEIHLLEFIESRVSSELYKKIDKSGEGSFYVRLLLAHALAGRDEIQHDEINSIFEALYILNELRNSVAHKLEFKSQSIRDQMKNFITKVDPSGSLRESNVTSDNLLIEFRKSAKYLCMRLALAKNPLKYEDEVRVEPNS